MKQSLNSHEPHSASLLDVERTRVVHSYRDALKLTNGVHREAVHEQSMVQPAVRGLSLRRWLKLYSLAVAGCMSCLVGGYMALGLSIGTLSIGTIDEGLSDDNDIAPLVSRYQDLEEYFGDSFVPAMSEVNVEGIIADSQGELQNTGRGSEAPRVLFTSSTSPSASAIRSSVKPVLIRLITQKVYDVVKKYPAKMDPVAVTSLIMSESLKAGIDPLFITSVIRVESAFNPKAKSPVGARGLMQIMPGTKTFIEDMEQIAPADRKSLYDARYNVRLGIAYIKYLTGKYSGNRGYALMAYNWGPGHLSKTMQNKSGAKVPTSVQRYAVDILGAHSAWNSQMTRRLLFEETERSSPTAFTEHPTCGRELKKPKK